MARRRRGRAHPLDKYLTGKPKILKAIKLAAKSAFAATPLGRTVRAANQLRRQATATDLSASLGVPRLRDIQATTRLENAFQNRDMANLIAVLRSRSPAAAFRMVEQYAAGDEHNAILRELLGSFGSIGKILGAILGSPQAGPQLSRQKRSALNYLESLADEPDVLQGLVRILEGKGAKVVWPGDTTLAKAKAPGPAPQPEEEPERDVGRTGQPKPGSRLITIEDEGQRRKMRADDPAITGEFVETPDSSNVHSFAYDLDRHALYVRFKYWEPDMGHDERPHVPGALYRYSNVPMSVFEAMMRAPSKGRFIWDNIRIRGTISGHRYDYALVGIQGGYVPRKATLTPRGEEYIGRSVFSNKGRRLSSRLGDRLVRPLQPVGRRPRNGQ